MLTTFHPFGVPFEIEAVAPAVADRVRAAIAGWEGAPDPAARRLRLDLRISPGLSGSGPPSISIKGDRLRLTARGLRCRADAVTGRASCVLSEDYAAEPELLQSHALDTVMLFLLTRSRRTPIHAAGVLMGEQAILLAGPSGAGKSCLAQAALDHGFAILSDDIVFAEPYPSNRVWGMRRPVHLFPEDAPVSGGEIRLRNGKLKQAVPIPAGGHAPTGHAAALCLLCPGGEAGLAPLSPVEALRSLTQLDAGFDLLARDINASLAALASRGAWRLDLSAAPADAIRVLRDNLPRLIPAAR